MAVAAYHLDQSHTCPRCKEDKPHTPDNFRSCNEVRAGRPYAYIKRVCRACEIDARIAYRKRNRVAENAKRRIANAGRYREGNLKKDHGITLAEYNAMLLRQGGVCAICHNPEKAKHQTGKIRSLCVDHNHETGEIRSLLCSKCNTGIGQFMEDPRILKNAIEYLEKHNG